MRSFGSNNFVICTTPLLFQPVVRKAFSHVRNSAILVYGIPEQVRGGSFQAGSCWRLGSSWHISQQMGSCLWGSQHPFSEWEVLSHDRDRSIFARGALERLPDHPFLFGSYLCFDSDRNVSPQSVS